jgi:hypothetical protein
LDAVAKITEQEGSDVTEEALLWKRSVAAAFPPTGKSYAALPLKPADRKTKASSTSIRRKNKPLTKRGTLDMSPSRKSPRKRQPPAAAASQDSPAKKSRSSEKKKIEDGTKKTVVEETKEAESVAKRAADLAQRTFTDPVLAKRLLLSMALKRENPRSGPDKLPTPGHEIPDGFVWAKYPPLEVGKL